MDLTISKKYEPLRSEIREFLDAHQKQAVSDNVGAGDEEAARGWQKLLFDHGYVGRTIPADYGGAGLEPDLLEAIVIEEEFRKARVSLGLHNQGIDMFVPTVLHFGTEEQKRAYIGPTIRGEMIWCQGYSEPGSGSDLASLTTRGELDGDEYVINGQKIWTSTAAQADMMFGLFRTEKDAGKHAGISYMVLSMDTPGIDVRPLKTMNGDKTFNEVFFTNVRVPRKNVIGNPGQGWEIGTYTLRHERHMLGRPQGSRRYLESAVSVLTDTGKIDDPLFRERLIRLEAKVMALEFHAMRLVTDDLQKRDSGVAGLVVKLYGCQLNYDLCALAIDALGERGLLKPGSRNVRDHGAWQQNYMYALGLIIGGGTAQIQKNIISEVGLGMPREPKVRAS